MAPRTIKPKKNFAMKLSILLSLLSTITLVQGFAPTQPVGTALRPLAVGKSFMDEEDAANWNIPDEQGVEEEISFFELAKPRDGLFEPPQTDYYNYDQDDATIAVGSFFLVIVGYLLSVEIPIMMQFIQQGGAVWM